MNKAYHEEMDGCPCQQGFRCSMNGAFCKEENCGPHFIYQEMIEKRLKKMLQIHCPWLEEGDLIDPS